MLNALLNSRLNDTRKVRQFFTFIARQVYDRMFSTKLSTVFKSSISRPQLETEKYLQQFSILYQQLKTKPRHPVRNQEQLTTI